MEVILGCCAGLDVHKDRVELAFGVQAQAGRSPLGHGHAADSTQDDKLGAG